MLVEDPVSAWPERTDHVVNIDWRFPTSRSYSITGRIECNRVGVSSRRLFRVTANGTWRQKLTEEGARGGPKIEMERLNRSDITAKRNFNAEVKNRRRWRSLVWNTTPK